MASDRSDLPKTPFANKDYRNCSVVEFVVSLVFPVSHGCKPGYHKDANYSETHRLEIQRPQRFPEWTAQLQLVRENLEKFDSADREGDSDRDDGHSKVVVYFPNRPEKRPAVRCKHRNPISHVDQDHSTGEHEVKNEDHPEWNGG